MFVLRKDIAGIIGKIALQLDEAEVLGLDHLSPSHIQKLSGDNTRSEKERVMTALRTG